jgi:hypothetical protein
VMVKIWKKENWAWIFCDFLDFLRQNKRKKITNYTTYISLSNIERNTILLSTETKNCVTMWFSKEYYRLFLRWLMTSKLFLGVGLVAVLVVSPLSLLLKCVLILQLVSKAYNKELCIVRDWVLLVLFYNNTPSVFFLFVVWEKIGQIKKIYFCTLFSY